MVNKSPGSFSWPHEEWPQVPFGEGTGTLIWQLSCWAGNQTHLLISPPMSWGQATSFYRETFSLRSGIKPLPTLFRDHRAHPHEVQWIYRVCAHQILLLWPQDLHDLEGKGLCAPRAHVSASHLRLSSAPVPSSCWDPGLWAASAGTCPSCSWQRQRAVAKADIGSPSVCLQVTQVTCPHFSAAKAHSWLNLGWSHVKGVEVQPHRLEGPAHHRPKRDVQHFCCKWGE